MKNNNLTSIGRKGVLLAIVIVLGSLISPAYCQDDAAILIQQTPANGGTITPDVGVYHLMMNTDVRLTATPKSGYQFAYWLGDVGEPTSSSTTVYLDSPKIIIAIFERVEHKFLIREKSATSAPAQGLRPHAADYARGGGGGGIGRKPSKWKWSVPVWPEPDEGGEPPVPENGDGDFPVPEDGDGDLPVPEIPEPATAGLLILGSFFAFSKHRKRIQLRRKEIK